MENAKDEIFDIKYNQEENTIEISKEKGTSKIEQFIKQNRLFSIILLLTIILGLINTILISNFVTLLDKI